MSNLLRLHRAYKQKLDSTKCSFYLENPFELTYFRYQINDSKVFFFRFSENLQRIKKQIISFYVSRKAISLTLGRSMGFRKPITFSLFCPKLEIKNLY